MRCNSQVLLGFYDHRFFCLFVWDYCCLLLNQESENLDLSLGFATNLLYYDKWVSHKFPRYSNLELEVP